MYVMLPWLQFVASGGPHVTVKDVDEIEMISKLVTSPGTEWAKTVAIHIQSKTSEMFFCVNIFKILIIEEL